MSDSDQDYEEPAMEETRVAVVKSKSSNTPAKKTNTRSKTKKATNAHRFFENDENMPQEYEIILTKAEYAHKEHKTQDNVETMVVRELNIHPATYEKERLRHEYAAKQIRLDASYAKEPSFDDFPEFEVDFNTHTFAREVLDATPLSTEENPQVDPVVAHAIALCEFGQVLMEAKRKQDTYMQAQHRMRLMDSVLKVLEFAGKPMSTIAKIQEDRHQKATKKRTHAATELSEALKKIKRLEDAARKAPATLWSGIDETTTAEQPMTQGQLPDNVPDCESRITDIAQMLGHSIASICDTDTLRENLEAESKALTAHKDKLINDGRAAARDQHK